MTKEVPANLVPAAAVIQEGQALFMLIGRTGRVGSKFIKIKIFGKN